MNTGVHGRSATSATRRLRVTKSARRTPFVTSHVLVSVEYQARPGQEDELMTALKRTRFSRRRTGATSWRAWRDASDASRILEQFVVASWDEHLRQHERVTKRDQDRLDRVRQLTDPAHPVTVTHWLTATPRKPPAR
jgi:Transmembrane secretion effector